MRSGDPVAVASAVTTLSNGTPLHSAAAAAASALGTCCIPCSASRTSPAPHGVDNWNRGRSSSSRHDALGAHVGVAERVTEDRTGADRGHARHIRIVEVQDRHAGGRQCGHELALRPGHPFEIAEELHVRHGHARHDADIGSAHVGQAGDVTRPTRSHLEDDPLDVVRRIEEGQREPELVVEGALAGCHHEGRREAIPEQVLGRRLADRAGDADHPALHALAHEQAKTKERHGGVPHDDRRPADGLRAR